MYTIDQPFAHVCIKFQLCRPHRKVWQKFNILEFARKKIEEIKEYINTSSPIQVDMIHQPTVHMWQSFNFVCLSVPEKRKIYIWKLERKKREEIKGRISRRNQVLFHTTTNDSQHFVPSYKILRAIVPEKYLSQISLCITLEWEMEKMRNKAK